MSDRQQINDLLRDIWPRVEQRIGRGRIDAQLMSTDRHVKINIDGRSTSLPLKEGPVDDYLERVMNFRDSVQAILGTKAMTDVSAWQLAKPRLVACFGPSSSLQLPRQVHNTL
jgi:hypothetical protein